MSGLKGRSGRRARGKLEREAYRVRHDLEVISALDRMVSWHAAHVKARVRQLERERKALDLYRIAPKEPVYVPAPMSQDVDLARATAERARRAALGLD